MAWRERFAAALSACWREHELAEGEAYAREYDGLIRELPVPPEVTGLADPHCRPLDLETLESVYRFGAFAGRQLGCLLGFPDEEAGKRAELCGCFNLGISLFDYLCDEHGRLESLLGRDPFRGLAAAAGLSPGVPDGQPDAAESALVTLADAILVEVANAVGPPDPSAPLWRGLVEMIGAEAGAARAALGPGIDPQKYLALLRDKSAGPFAWMAEWMAAGDESRQSTAVPGETGEALGGLYWLIDDARDLWEDLDARRCNLFLLHAAMLEPDLLEHVGTPWFELELSRILLLPDFIPAIADPFVGAFARRLAELPDPGSAANIGGLVWRSLVRWLE